MIKAVFKLAIISIIAVNVKEKLEDSPMYHDLCRKAAEYVERKAAEIKNKHSIVFSFENIVN